MNLELWQQEFLQGTLAPTFPRAPRMSPLRVRPQRHSRRRAGATAAAPEVANSAEPPKAGACEHARRRLSQRGPGASRPGAQCGAGSEREKELGGDSPFCSLLLPSWSLLLRLDSARVPGLWPARADVSRRSPKRSIGLSGRARGRRALGERGSGPGSAPPGEGRAGRDAPRLLWPPSLAGHFPHTPIQDFLRGPSSASPACAEDQSKTWT